MNRAAELKALLDSPISLSELSERLDELVSSSEAEEPAAWMLDAVSLFELHRFEELRALLLRTLEAGEDSADLFWLLALAYYGLGAFDHALLTLSESLKRDAHHADRLKFLGGVFERLGVFTLAAEAYRSALEIDPEDATALAKRLALRRQEDTLALDEESYSLWARIPAYARPTLSACLIVKNEERNLPGCLSSIRPYVDEIVLVDTGSTDRTLEIAAQFGARIFHFEWNDDFSAARNVSLSHASGDWILIIDADERLLPLDRQQLARRLRSREAQCLEIRCHNVNEQGERLDAFPASRLFLRHPDARYTGRVHNTLGPAFLKLGYEKVSVPWIELEHHGFVADEMLRAAKFERGLRLTRREIVEHPERPESWMHYLRMAMATNQHGEARRAVAEIMALEASDRFLEQAQRRYFIFLASIFFKEAGEEACLSELLARGLEAFPGAPELLFESGLLAMKRGDLQGALLSFERIFLPEPSVPALPPSPLLAGIDGYGAALEALKCAELLGDVKRCYFYLKTALEDPALPSAWRLSLEEKLRELSGAGLR